VSAGTGAGGGGGVGGGTAREEAARSLGGHPGARVLARLKQYLGHEPADGAVMLEMVAACARLRANIDGVEAEILQGLQRVHPGNALGEELAARLSITTGVADRLISRAAALQGYIEVHFALLGADIDARKAEVFIDATATLPDAQARAIHRALLPQAPGLTTGQLKRRLRAAVLAVDGDLASKRHQRAVKERHVSVEPADDGMALLTFYLPATDAAAAMLALDALATKNGPEDERSIGARRVDAFIDIINQILTSDQSPDGTPVPTQHRKHPHLVFTIAQSTLDGEDDAPGYLAGHGPLPADIIRHLANNHDGHHHADEADDDVDEDGYDDDEARRDDGPGEHDQHDGATRRDDGPGEHDDDAVEHTSGGEDRAAGHGQDSPAGPEVQPHTARTDALSGTLLPPPPPTKTGESGESGGSKEGGTGAAFRKPETDPVRALAKYGILATDAYQPGAALREFILARDLTCRFPTCGQPARRCQIDHITPFDPDKPAWTQTHQGNLHLLCQRHHQLKTDGAWNVRRDPNTGDTHWTSALGYHYTRPAEIIDPTHHLPALHRALDAIRAEHADQPHRLQESAPLDPGIISDEELARLRCRAWPHHHTGTADHASDTTDQKHDGRPNEAPQASGASAAGATGADAAGATSADTAGATSADTAGATNPDGERPTIHGPSRIRCICADHSNNINDILDRLRPPPKEPTSGEHFPTGNDPPPY